MSRSLFLSIRFLIIGNLFHLFAVGLSFSKFLNPGILTDFIFLSIFVIFMGIDYLANFNFLLEAFEAEENEITLVFPGIIFLILTLLARITAGFILVADKYSFLPISANLLLPVIPLSSIFFSMTLFVISISKIAYESENALKALALSNLIISLVTLFSELSNIQFLSIFLLGYVLKAFLWPFISIVLFFLWSNHVKNHWQESEKLQDLEQIIHEESQQHYGRVPLAVLEERTGVPVDNIISYCIEMIRKGDLNANIDFQNSSDLHDYVLIMDEYGDKDREEVLMEIVYDLVGQLSALPLDEPIPIRSITNDIPVNEDVISEWLSLITLPGEQLYESLEYDQDTNSVTRIDQQLNIDSFLIDELHNLITIYDEQSKPESAIPQASNIPEQLEEQDLDRLDQLGFNVKNIEASLDNLNEDLWQKQEKLQQELYYSKMLEEITDLTLSNKNKSSVISESCQIVGELTDVDLVSFFWYEGEDGLLYYEWHDDEYADHPFSQFTIDENLQIALYDMFVNNIEMIESHDNDQNPLLNNYTINTNQDTEPSEEVLSPEAILEDLQLSNVIHDQYNISSLLWIPYNIDDDPDSDRFFAIGLYQIENHFKPSEKMIDFLYNILKRFKLNLVTSSQ